MRGTRPGASRPAPGQHRGHHRRGPDGTRAHPALPPARRRPHHRHRAQPARRAKAAELGADVVLDPAKEDAVAVVRELTEGRGADCVIEAVGDVGTYRDAFDMVRAAGPSSPTAPPPATRSSRCGRLTSTAKS